MNIHCSSTAMCIGTQHKTKKQSSAISLYQPTNSHVEAILHFYFDLKNVKNWHKKKIFAAPINYDDLLALSNWHESHRPVLFIFYFWKTQENVYRPSIYVHRRWPAQWTFFNAFVTGLISNQHRMINRYALVNWIRKWLKDESHFISGAVAVALRDFVDISELLIISCLLCFWTVIKSGIFPSLCVEFNCGKIEV